MKIIDLLGSEFQKKSYGNKILINPCPFCGHKNHFFIYLNTNRYYSYSCNNYGDVIDFLVNYQKMSKYQAITLIKNDNGQIKPKKQDKTDYNLWINKIFDEIINICNNSEQLLLKNNTKKVKVLLIFIRDYFENLYWRLINIQEFEIKKKYLEVLKQYQDAELDFRLAIKGYIKILGE